MFVVTMSMIARLWELPKCPQTCVCVCVWARARQNSTLTQIESCRLQRHGCSSRGFRGVKSVGQRKTNTVRSHSCGEARHKINEQRKERNPEADSKPHRAHGWGPEPGPGAGAGSRGGDAGARTPMGGLAGLVRTPQLPQLSWSLEMRLAVRHGSSRSTAARWLPRRSWHVGPPPPSSS